MDRIFLETPIFQKEWQEAGLTDEDLKELQGLLLEHPDCGDVIKGTGGIRKIRVGTAGRGKRGGGRVIYKDFAEFQFLVLLYIYRKTDKIDLSNDEKKAMTTAIEKLGGEIARMVGKRGGK